MINSNTLEKENRPALPLWARILLVCFAFILFGGLFEYATMKLLGYSRSQMTGSQAVPIFQQLVMNLVFLVSTLMVITFFRLKVDRRSFLSLGLAFNHRWKDLLMGFVISLVIIGGGSALLFSLHSIDFSVGVFEFETIFLSFVMFVMVAFNEEILMRGYILNNLMTGMNRYIALLISALIFSLFHGLNPNISLLALFNIGLAGILLGSTYIFTRNLWFPISLHLFWNFIQGPVIGYPVSGQQIVSLFQIHLHEKSSLNGGDFGFEGSLVCTMLLILTIGLIFSYYKIAESKELVAKV